MTETTKDLLAELDRLVTTMTNDDKSRVGTDMRKRFIERVNIIHIIREHVSASLAREAAQQARIERLLGLLNIATRAIGDHHAPHDCYATGPLTGDHYSDFLECPACSFTAALEATP